MAKRRLDVLLVERGLAATREKAKALILAGDVRVSGQVVRAPSTAVRDDAPVAVERPPRFVGRGGLKLDHALDVFRIDVTDRVAGDIGASTGGFTDCLLQRGTRRVYAIDVGYGQLDYRLRTDPRVVVMDRINARYLAELPETLDLAVMDVSFISVRLILPAIWNLLAPDGGVVTLVKPQFEAGRERVGKKGVIQDATVHRDVLRDVGGWAVANGWAVRAVTASPIRGAEGNREFFYHLGRTGPSIDLDPAIEAALSEPAGREVD